MRPAKVAAGQVGQALLAVFRRDGYAGASLRDLSGATGLKSASLYHRFPAGKADMARAALAHAAEAFKPLVIDPLLGDATPATRLRESAEGLARFYAGGEQACLLAVLVLSDAPPAVGELVAATFRAWHDALAATLADAGITDPEPRALDRIAALQGALVLRKAGLSASAFAAAVARLGQAAER